SGRFTHVAGLAHARIQRDFAEQRDVHVVGEPPAAPVTEYVDVAPAVRALHAGHVLDDAEDPGVDALEHAHRASHVAGRYLLRCRDEHGTIEVHDLDQ